MSGRVMNFTSLIHQQMPKLLIAGNYHYYNSGIIAAATQIPQLRLMGIIETMESAFERVSDYQPDILLVDVFMNQMTGFEISRMLAEQRSDVKVVVVSETFNNTFRQTAMDLKLHGYVPKNIGDDRLTEMYLSMLSGNTYFASEAKS